MVSSSSPYRQKLVVIIFFVFCFFAQILPVVRSGLPASYGLGFWGPNGHDGLWHLSLINTITNPLKISHPSFAGETLKNYHPFYDILLAFVSRLTAIDSSFLLFQIFPIILSLALICLSYRLGLVLFKNKLAGYLLVFLNTLGGSFGWIYTFVTAKNFYGESLFWSMQSISNQLNPPYALSLVILLILILLLLNLQKKPFLIIVLTAVLPITKIYAGIVWYVFFFFYSLRHKYYLRIFFFSLIPSLLLFLLYNSPSSGLLQFSPLWFIHSLFQSQDHLYFPKLVSFQYNTWLAGHIFDPRYLLMEIVGIAVFVIGNFSFRLLGFIKIKNNTLFFIPPILLGLTMPLLFIQKGTPWNTIQFLYYSLFLSNIFLAGWLSRLPSNSQKIIIPIIVLTTLISNIGSFQTYLGNPPPTAITPNELNALKFLRSQPQGNVLTFPYDQYARNLYPHTPIPIYTYETTSYVSAYTGKSVYLADYMNLNISGYDWQKRLQQQSDFFLQKNPDADRGFLVNNHIDYLFLDGPKAEQVNFHPQLSLVRLYQQGDVSVYKVNR